MCHFPYTSCLYTGSIDANTLECAVCQITNKQTKNLATNTHHDIYDFTNQAEQKNLQNYTLSTLCAGSSKL